MIQQGRARRTCAPAIISKTETPETDWGDARETEGQRIDSWAPAEAFFRASRLLSPLPKAAKNCSDYPRLIAKSIPLQASQGSEIVPVLSPIKAIVG